MKLTKEMGWTQIKKMVYESEDMLHIEHISENTKLIVNDDTKESVILMFDRYDHISHMYQEVHFEDDKQEIDQGKEIPLKEWAEKNGINPATARQKAGRGSLKTAHKIGRDWMINENEVNQDNRRK